MLFPSEERGRGRESFFSVSLSLATYFLECFIILMKTIYIIKGTIPSPINSNPFPVPEPVLGSGSLLLWSSKGSSTLSMIYSHEKDVVPSAETYNSLYFRREEGASGDSQELRVSVCVCMCVRERKRAAFTMYYYLGPILLRAEDCAGGTPVDHQL